MTEADLHKKEEKKEEPKAKSPTGVETPTKGAQAPDLPFQAPHPPIGRLTPPLLAPEKKQRVANPQWHQKILGASTVVPQTTGGGSVRIPQRGIGLLNNAAQSREGKGAGEAPRNGQFVLRPNN